MERREKQITPHRKAGGRMKGRYRAKHFRNTEHTGLRRLLSVILCLCLLTSVLQIQMITAFAATKIDSVTVTHEGRKTEKLILP